MNTFRQILKTMRPRQWPKNLFIFGALVFDRQFFHAQAFWHTLAGFALLCIASGIVYIVNDIADRQQDCLHPVKKNRPIASGALSVGAASIAAGMLTVVCLALSYLLNPFFLIMVVIYIVLNLAYSFRLKQVPIVDALVVSSFFVLRVACGVVLISVERFSPWLYLCMLLLALFISFGKRRAELTLLANGASNHRKVLDGYSLGLLDNYILIVLTATLVMYSLYTFDAPNLPANHAMMLTIPFVLYAVFRYLYLLQVENTGGAPEDVILTDRPLQIAVGLWGLAVMAVMYLGA
jgi:4-hydroxybenzoate polyprenyltransferase